MSNPNVIDGPEGDWQKVETKQSFVTAFADKILGADDLTFTIGADGTMFGKIGEATLTGRWEWRDVYFCRTAELDGEDLGLDCESIEMRGNQMRYTRNKGAGNATVVTIL